MIVEKAILITDISHFQYWNPEYSRVYFGEEFCERLIPDQNEIANVLEFIEKKKLLLTIITPYVTDAGIKKIQTLLDIVDKNTFVDEIIFNDWGVFNLLKNSRFPLAMGRLLTKQIKDPRLSNNVHLYSKASLGELQQLSLNNLTMRFLLRNKVKRVEIDNSLVGINLKILLDEPSAINMKFSLYIPYGFIATSRFCYAAQLSAKSVIGTVVSCNYECKEYTFELKHNKINAPLFLKGNTIFFRNDNIPDNIQIDRLVYEPTLPI